MCTVNVAELKNRLSTYLTYAKSGEVIGFALKMIRHFPSSEHPSSSKIMTSDAVLSRPGNTKQ